VSRARVVSATAAALVAAVSLGACKTERVSVNSGEEQANGESTSASISRDGRYVAFWSRATNLVPNPGLAGDVFVRDRVAGQTSLVTVGTGTGTGAGMQQISANGRYVAFDSYDKMTPDDTGEDRDIFVWDRETGVTTRASVGTGGHEGNANSAIPSTYSDIAISRNGRYVAFESSSTDLVQGDTNGLDDIFVRDRTAGTTTRVPFESTGEPATEPDSSTPVGLTYPVLSLDGRHVGFASARVYPAPNPILRLGTDLYVRNLDTGATTKVTPGVMPEGAGIKFSLDAHGEHVAFSSYAEDLVPSDDNGKEDIFVRDLPTGALTRVPAEVTGAGGIFYGLTDPSLSRTGRFLAFTTDPYTTSNVYVHDRQTGLTRRLTKDHTAATQPYNLAPRISADGRWVAYESTDPTAVQGDTNDVPDVFVSSGRPIR
jgi:Tol biopolymer transport system component